MIVLCVLGPLIAGLVQNVLFWCLPVIIALCVLGPLIAGLVQNVLFWCLGVLFEIYTQYSHNLTN